MIVLASIFRDSVSYLDRYFAQVHDLGERMNVQLVLAEGDSSDDTLDKLRSYNAGQVLCVNHGGPRYGSVDNPQRWHNIAIVVRRVLEEVIKEEPDVVVWVESDLIWDTEDMVRLIDAAKNGRSVAPMVFASDGPRFYDTWGFRQNGQGFYAHQPYFPQEPVMEEVYAKIDSCGSCFATPDTNALSNWDGFWPYRADGKLWLDTLAKVVHP